MDKKFKIQIIRTNEFNNIKFKNKKSVEKIGNSTVGKLQIINKTTNEILYSCYTVECPGPATDESGKKKRIIPRTYYLKWKSPTGVSVPKEYYSPKRAPHLYSPELPSFEGRQILIHIGNVGELDVSGCIGVGEILEKNGVVGSSTIACKKVFDILDKFGIQNFELTIEEKINYSNS